MDVDDHPKPRRETERPERVPASDPVPTSTPRETARESDADDVGRRPRAPHRAESVRRDGRVRRARASSRGAVAGTDRPSFFALVPPAKRRDGGGDEPGRNASAKTCNSPSRKSRAASLGRDAETNAETRVYHRRATKPTEPRGARARRSGDEIVRATPLETSSPRATTRRRDFTARRAYARAPTRRAETPRTVPNAHAASFEETETEKTENVRAAELAELAELAFESRALAIFAIFAIFAVRPVRLLRLLRLLRLRGAGTNDDGAPLGVSRDGAF